MRSAVLIAAVSCLVSTLPAPAQEALPAFERISLEQGLSQSIIEGIAQDRKGFLWFATEEGVNRYDGYRFNVLRHSAADPASLSHNEVKSIHVDRTGVLWAGTFAGGLNRIDPSTGEVRRFRHDPADPSSLSADTVRAVLMDRSGGLWVGTQGGGLDRLDPEGKGFAHFRHDAADPGSLPHDDVRVLLEDRAGELWVGTYGGGFARFDRASGRFARRRAAPGEPAGSAADQILGLHEDRAGTLWIATYGGGLCAFEPASGRTLCHRGRLGDPGALGSDLVRTVVEDHRGTLWVGTDGGGLCRLARDHESFACFRHDPADPTSLASDRVWSLFEDRSQVLWVGTYGGGLSRLDVARKPFQHLRHLPGDANSLSHDIVWSIREGRDGVLWIGTDSGGLNRFDRRTGRWTAWRHDPAIPASLAHDAIRAIAEDPDGALWLATNGGGLDRFDPRSGRFTHHRHDPSDPRSLAHDELRAILRDRAGRLWVATFGGGLERLDPPHGFVHYRHDPSDPASLPSDFVRVLLEDRRGSFWIGTHGTGLARLDRETGRFTSYRASPTDPAALGSDYVFALLEARDGAIWVGTYGGGIHRFEPESGRFTRFTTAHGLVSDSVYGLLEDARGRIWVSTNRGLSCFDPGDGSFRNFDVRDGLQSNEFDAGAQFASAGGELFFGGIRGVNSFRPEEIGLNSVVPAVVITDLQLFNRSIASGERVGGHVPLARPIEYADVVELSHRDSVVTLEFAALHFTAPEKNRYAYALEGFTEGWIAARPDRRSATFTGLSPGSYRFRVRAANADGVWNEEGTSVLLVVKPPFWATGWFRAGAGIAVALLGSFAYTRRMRHVRLRTELAAAHQAQMAIMPQSDPCEPGFEISGACLPAHEVGGDFFDYFRLPEQDGRLCVAVGDISGKAMRAAMTAVMTSGMVATQADVCDSLAEILTRVNRALYRKAERPMFAALCLAALDGARRELALVNAGLCPPLLWAEGSVRELTSAEPRLPLGGLRDTAYRVRTETLAPGSVVLLYTDGVPEATDRAGRPFGYERLAALLAGLEPALLPAAAITREVIAAVTRHTGGRRPADDVAVVAIKSL